MMHNLDSTQNLVWSLPNEKYSGIITQQLKKISGMNSIKVKWAHFSLYRFIYYVVTINNIT